MSQTPDAIAFFMENGHPPSADKVACIDFDGTIVDKGPLMGPLAVKPFARSTIQALKDMGYTIVIFTSRVSQKWLGSEFRSLRHQQRDAQVEFVTNVLREAGIPFDRITADKVPAEFYIDDKAIRFEGSWHTTLSQLQQMGVFE